MHSCTVDSTISHYNSCLNQMSGLAQNHEDEETGLQDTSLSS